MKQNRTVADAILGSLLREGQAARAAADIDAGEKLVLPVIQETAEVRKRRVETGKVRIEKLVSERSEVIDEPLLQEQVTVERVAINRVVAEPMPIRYEGDTMIVPLLEEVVVVSKRLVLKEELHITKRRTTVHQPQQVTLRREEAQVRRGEDVLGKEAKLTSTIQAESEIERAVRAPMKNSRAAAPVTASKAETVRKTYDAPARVTPAVAPRAPVAKHDAKKKADIKKNKKKKGKG